MSSRRRNTSRGYFYLFILIVAILLIKKFINFIKPYVSLVINSFKDPAVIRGIRIFLGYTSVTVMIILIIIGIIRTREDYLKDYKVNPKLKAKWKQNNMMTERRWKKCYRNDLLPFIPIMQMIYGKKFDLYKESYRIWKAYDADCDKWMVAFIKKLDEIFYFRHSNFTVEQVDKAVEQLTKDFKVEVE